MKLQRVFTKLELEDGQRIPRGYGLAYWKVSQGKAVFYPIPINVLVNLCRKVQQLVMFPSAPALDRLIQEAYSRGIRDGSMATLTRIHTVVNEALKK